MANIIRSAKSGSDWGLNELVGFNISIVDQDAATFFGHPNLPELPHISPVILENVRSPGADRISKADHHFFGYMEDAMIPESESLVDDFAVFLLQMMDYDTGSRILHTRKEMSFQMCGQNVSAKADICLVDRSQRSCILLVQEDKVSPPSTIFPLKLKLAL